MTHTLSHVNIAEPRFSVVQVQKDLCIFAVTECLLYIVFRYIFPCYHTWTKRENWFNLNRLIDIVLQESEVLLNHLLCQ